MELTGIEVEDWLAEDLGDGDATSLAVVDEAARCDAEILLKETGVVCGLEVAAAVFEATGARLLPLVADGDRADSRAIARVDGPASASP